MRANSLEELIPGLAEVRAEEQWDRARVLSGLGMTLLGFEVEPFCPEHRLHLQLIRNAFLSDREPLEGDVFTYLWALSPWRSRGGLWAPGRWWHRRKARRIATRVDLKQAERAIQGNIAVAFQDQPGVFHEGDTRPDHSAHLHWFAEEAGFWMTTHRMGLAEYRRTPYGVLQALFRAYQVANPQIVSLREGDKTVHVLDEPAFRSRSEEHIHAWLKQQAPKLHTEPRERLP